MIIFIFLEKTVKSTSTTPKYMMGMYIFKYTDERMITKERYLFRAADGGKDFGDNYFHEPWRMEFVFDYSANPKDEKSYIALYLTYKFKKDNENQRLFTPIIF